MLKLVRSLFRGLVTMGVVAAVLGVLWILMPYAWQWQYNFWQFLRNLFSLAVVLVLWLGLAGAIVAHLDATLAGTRRAQRVVTALIVSLGIPIFAIWRAIGVPPTSRSAVAGLSFFVCFQVVLSVIAVCTGIVLRVYALEAKHLSFRLVAVATIVIANVVLFLLPVVWTLAEHSLAADSLRAESLKPHACPSPNDTVVLAHISDLHIAKTAVANDGAPSGNSRLPTLLTVIASRKPSYLVISGDITDTGDWLEWKHVKRIFQTHELAAPVMLAPGNHDLNLFFGADPDLYDVPMRGGARGDLQTLPKLARLMDFQSRSFPDLRASNGALLKQLVEGVPRPANIGKFDGEINQCISDCRDAVAGADHPGALGLACTLRCKRDWRAIRYRYISRYEQTFPWTFVDEKNRIALFSFASTVTGTSTAGENAIGVISDDQIDRFASLLKSLPANIDLIVLAMHHPLFNEKITLRPKFSLSDLARPRQTWDTLYNSDWFVSIFLRNDSVRARRLYDVLTRELKSRSRTQALVMFGHRHRRQLTALNSVFFVEAPNVATTLPQDYGFYAVTRRGSSPVQVHWCELRD